MNFVSRLNAYATCCCIIVADGHQSTEEGRNQAEQFGMGERPAGPIDGHKTKKKAGTINKFILICTYYREEFKKRDKNVNGQNRKSPSFHCQFPK